MKKLSITLALLTAGCVVYQPVPTYRLPPPPVASAPSPYPPPPGAYPPPAPPVESAPIAYEAPPQPVVSVYVEPPIEQPAPIACPWAPPPMLVEEPPPPPSYGAVWIGGFWVWHGVWVWDYGRWAEPPRPSYHWVAPYYEHRDRVVIFITGHWASLGVEFVPPPRERTFEVERPLVGVVAGPAPIGPEGVFVPAPPGSRPGIIVPAPLGTAPAVVTSAPPVVNVGMRITNNVNSNNTTVINNVTNVTNVTNITHVTIVAPASATATGQAVNATVPAQAHLAAALTPAVRVAAPPPATQQPIPAFARGRAPIALPPPQVVHVSPRAEARSMQPVPAAATPTVAPMTPRAAPVQSVGTPEPREPLEHRDVVRQAAPAPAAPVVQPAPAARQAAPAQSETADARRAQPHADTRAAQGAQPAVSQGDQANQAKSVAAPKAAPPVKKPANAQQAAAAQGKGKPEAPAPSGDKRKAVEKEHEKAKEQEKERVEH
ncbi:MAG TPA: hypothetical protein VMQ45_06710 [Burkholderiaceae bacterium]|nr:hypothetical protein [Burkholderiaceae bacterium]